MTLLNVLTEGKNPHIVSLAGPVLDSRKSLTQNYEVQTTFEDVLKIFGKDWVDLFDRVFKTGYFLKRFTPIHSSLLNRLDFSGYL